MPPLTGQIGGVESVAKDEKSQGSKAPETKPSGGMGTTTVILAAVVAVIAAVGVCR